MYNFVKWMIPMMGIVSIVHAEPTLYPTQPSVLSSIKNTTNSNILDDEVDNRTVWVLPPNTAQASVSGLHTRTANLGFCAEMGDLKGYSRELSKQMKDLSVQRVQKKEKIEKLVAEASQAREQAEKFATEKNMSALLDLDVRIGNTEARLSDLYILQQKCENDCEVLQTEVRDLLAAKRAMLKDRNRLAKQNAADFVVYDRQKKKAEAKENSVKREKSAYLDFMLELTSIQNQFKEMFANFGKMEGARAAIKYTSSWDSNIDQLRRENPGINFSKVATKNAVLMTEMSGIKDIDPTSAVKAIAVPGGASDGSAQFVAYPENLTANVILSLIGACPMEHPDYFDLNENDVRDMSYGIIITYDYDSIFRVKGTAKYNMYKMYQKIVSSGSSGGFFSSRSWSNVEETNFFRDSFTVIWDDRENTLSAEQKSSREKEMRASVLERLANYALPTAPNRGEVISAGQPPARGAAVVSNSLMQVCPANIYCVGASAVFRVLDAIFGSSNTSASYKNIVDVEVVENYENSQKITKAWMTSYVKP